MMKPVPDHEKGASEIIGSLLLIAIIVSVVSVVAAILFSQPAPDKVPAVYIVIENSSRIVTITHGGGDSIPLNEIKISIDNTPLSFSCDDCGSTWSIGKTLTVISPWMPNRVDVVYNTTYKSQQVLITKFLYNYEPGNTHDFICIQMPISSSWRSYGNCACKLTAA
jgi:flagellin-like protein